ncbi:hypothetical protein PFICI_02276 [Pestalotiopsis fici W106-1]|uniref:Zn(2)-C6 fungal-type domain-containing protein n=1 Tax=Pestalotiopsis fici (strain W106-1 / CGMCC3.15140) TaxID=1229662 RepID=W3XGD7_PESFW|nr:uncharacterized protein PFICI_02276 [Pestalotiopsis fici W106-1]ETS84251.1 hypothetical protein PFICI_02276 [Pestalotiopsis fici W106-1]
MASRNGLKPSVKAETSNRRHQGSAFRVVKFDHQTTGNDSGHSSRSSAAPQPPTLSRPPQLRPRQIKSRSGCESCKRRRIKCDEGQPQCQRCKSRGLVCTGNFKPDVWQIERPWIYTSHKRVQRLSMPATQLLRKHQAATKNVNIHSVPPHSARVLENELVRHWFEHTCTIMGIVPQSRNPLSYSLSPYLRRSCALRHSIQCISQAHSSYFTDAHLAEVLEERARALASLRLEIERAFIGESACSRAQLLPTILLSSLILGITSDWLTKDLTSQEFLIGANQIVPLLLESGVKQDPVSHYVLGLYLYWVSVESHIEPWEPDEQHQRQHEFQLSYLHCIVDRCLANTVHPVTGLAAGVLPLMWEAGRYYRRVSQGYAGDATYAETLQSKLEAWTPPTALCSLEKGQPLIALAEAYRAAALLLLYQARCVSDRPPMAATSLAMSNETVPNNIKSAISTIVGVLGSLSPGDPLLTSVGPFLVIAGSELQEDQIESRNLIHRIARQVTQYTRVPNFSSALNLVEEVWARRASGSQVTWLELMLQNGYILGIA